MIFNSENIEQLEAVPFELWFSGSVDNIYLRPPKPAIRIRILNTSFPEINGPNYILDYPIIRNLELYMKDTKGFTYESKHVGLE